jgi:hypothetical protein
MENPWTALPRESPFLLDTDRKCVEQHNQSATGKTQFIIESIPEPFIGNPKLAKVVFLGKNPGHSAEDKKSHDDQDFRTAMYNNLHHSDQSYPFYPLNPKFAWTGAGRWWSSRTRELRAACGLPPGAFSERIMVIEWFPYHSTAFKVPKQKSGSQEYSFLLAKEMLDKGVLVVGLRARKLWTSVDYRFGEIAYLRNPLCGHISPGNTEAGLFGQIVRAIQGGA